MPVGYCLWPYLLLGIFCIGSECQIVETRTNLGLTSIPGNLNNHVEELFLDDNAFTSITFPPGYNRLYKFSAKNNLLTEFPDLRTLAASLRDLLLVSNQISYVDPRFLDALTQLENLHMGYNFLSQIPDVPGPSQSLVTLRIYGNYFEDLPPIRNLGKSLTGLYIGNGPLKKLTLERLLDMPNLTYIGMTGTQVETFPNFCRLARFVTRVLATTTPYLVCNCHLRWVKVMQASNFDLELGQFPCAQPVDLNGRNWSTITSHEMGCEGDIRSFQMYPVTPSYSCLYPGFIEVQSSSDVLSCAMKCVHSATCLMFGYDYSVVKLTNNCAITDMTSLTRSLTPPTTGTWSWYTVE